RNPERYTRTPTPETLNPNPQTTHPKPETRNPKPETRNPKPETRNPSQPNTLLWQGGRGDARQAHLRGVVCCFAGGVGPLLWGDPETLHPNPTLR
ncbi:hypothetical protein T484DRAFT_1630695, partial [Baffinella frigidus]